jgi:hypothetical protein
MAAHNPTPAQVIEALLYDNEDLFLLDNLIATGEALFSLIWLSEIDERVKQIAFQLEKRFNFYATLLESKN